MLDNLPAQGTSGEASNLPTTDEGALRDGGTFSVGKMPTHRPWAHVEDDFTDGYGTGDVGGGHLASATLDASHDFFSALGTERVKPVKEDKPNPDKVSQIANGPAA